MITIRIPTPLRSLAAGKEEVAVEGMTVKAALDDLEARHPGFQQRVLDAKGELRRFINLFVNQNDVRTLGGLGTELRDGDSLSIIPAIAGGTSGKDIINEARKRFKEINASDAKGRIGKPGVVLIDVREGDEFRNGYIPGATHVARGYLEIKVESTVPDKNSEIILYCGGGTRSLLAAETMSRLGYTNLFSLQGGYGQWTRDGGPVEKPVVLSESDRRRYARHLTIPEVGEKGQAKLLQSKVLMVGAGGLGCPAAYYLAAAGVGTMGLVDFDVVDESNLQRQILHPTSRVGTSKVSSALKTLSDFNPSIKLVPFEERLTSENVERIFAGYDIIIDGSDNFPTRYLINDASVHLKKPCVHGSVYRFEGQVTVFDPARGGPCYRCLYPEPPPADMAPSCAEAGVLGVLPGVIGLLEAVETVKLLLGIGDPLVGRLLSYDGLKGSFREFNLKRDPDCQYCGDGKTFPGYVDYETFCATPA